MLVKGLKAPEGLTINFAPSPRQYEMWKLLQPNYCPHCGGEIELIVVSHDEKDCQSMLRNVKNVIHESYPKLYLEVAPAAVARVLSVVPGLSAVVLDFLILALL